MMDNRKVVETIDLTPTWEETVQTLVALIEGGNADARSTATNELRRMARLADIASIVLGSHRRPDAPKHDSAEAIKAALSSWQELVAYTEDRPPAGTQGAELYAQADAVKARFDAIISQPKQSPDKDRRNP